MIEMHIGAVSLRPAVREDVPLILELICELAEYERLRDSVVADAATLTESLFGGKPEAEVVIAEWRGEPAGFALYFHNFSTFMGRRGLYLEDLFVRPRFRGHGIGRVLMRYLARLALERNCGRFEWAVLEWNEPAIRFYRAIGAQGIDDWRIQRMTGPAIESLAAES